MTDLTTTHPVRISRIRVPEDRARSYDEERARALAASIEAQGLFHPISVREDVDGLRLVIGLHRLRAFEMLGRDTIPARMSEAESDDAARFEEVMENLVRVELIALDRCQHLYELKQVYERLYPETAHGKASGKRQTLPLSSDEPEILSFSEATAEKIGLSQRSIRLAVTIWKGLAAKTRARLYGTPLASKQTELKALSELSPARQAKVLDLILGPEDVTNVAGAVAALDGGYVPNAVEKRIEALRTGLRDISDDALVYIAEEHADRLIAALKKAGRLT